MTNLEKAMNEEKLYLEDKMNGVETVLIDRLTPYGYNSLAAYFKAKKDYEFSKIKFNFVEEPMPNGVSAIFKVINTNEPSVLFVDWGDTYVVCGNRGIEEFNQEYCKAHNIPFFPLYTNGGTIVGSSGDFSLGIYCSKSIIDDAYYILNNVANILQKYTFDSISVEGNDIVANGKKICGSANYIQNNMLMVIMHFSFNNWTNLISKICLTTKNSKPVGYVNFIKKEQFKKEILIWLQKS